MNYYNNDYDRGYTEATMSAADYMARTYRWMACGLAVTFGVALLTAMTPLFFLVNSYTTGLAPAVLTYMLGTELKAWNGHVESQEIGLPVTESGLVLPCGASGRWER